MFQKQWSISSSWQQRMKWYILAIKRRGRKTKFLRQKIKIQHTLKTQKVKVAIGYVWKRNALMKTNGLKMEIGLLVPKINGHGGEVRRDSVHRMNDNAWGGSMFTTEVVHSTIDKNQKCIKSFNSLLWIMEDPLLWHGCYVKPHVPEKISTVICNLPQRFINLEFSHVN